MLRSCDPEYCRLCARAVLDRVRAVRALVAPVRKAKDPEAVHDMRVASRRLRAALALFGPCLPRPAGEWRKAIRKVTRALGRARDLDVQIATVLAAQRKRGHTSWRAGMERLLAGLRRRRRAAQGKVNRALTRMVRSGILDEMERSLKAPAGAGPGDRADQAGPYRLAEGAIRPLLDELESFDADLLCPTAVRRHHAMRIAAKRLRYSLEVFEPLYGPALGPSLRAARDMQTLLGDLHDCDVWVQSLPGALPAEKASAGKDRRRQRRLAQGIEEFRRDRLRRRGALYRRSVAYWRKCRKEKTWLILRRILAGPPGRTPPRLRARGARSR